MECFSCAKVFFMKKILLLSTCFLAVNLSFGQSDKQLTHYMADQISFNPGATGFKGYCGTLIYRNQWFGFDGAPNTVLFNAQANIQKVGMGVGISFMNDNIGFFSENDFKINVAKHFEFVGAGYLSAGLGLGLINGSYVPEWLAPETGIDVTLDPNLPNADGGTSLDLNFGLFWRDADNRYYAGLSATHLAAPELDNINFKKARHYYATGGMNITYDMLQIDPRLTLKPSFLVISDLVSTTMDITAIADFRMRPEQSIYAGISYRRKDAVAILLGSSLDITPKSGKAGSNLGSLGSTQADVVSFGLSYDITTSNINTPSNGSLEIWANYCLFPKDPAKARYGNPFILE
jgi:type IX secretion system PorP/SprF family membrane protein